MRYNPSNIICKYSIILHQNMEQYKIRELSYIDYHNRYLELLQQHFTIVPSDISVQTFTNFIGNLGPNHKVFVIEKEVPEVKHLIDTKYLEDIPKKTIIVGSITILIEQKIIRSMGKVAHIEDLITHESYRGQHIAKQLLQHAKEYAKQNACYKISLNCDASLVRFYERNNFVNKETHMTIYL
jgi:ribosomal protein S18 acetylase RimI-like enzyme